MINKDIISMPDKWEYPWYAAWDLAFHTLPLSIVDPDFAKQQMQLMLMGVYLHPNGQMPAYEWNFSDVNPPVHAFATLFLHRTEQALRGETDLDFLRATFNKLVLNFTWWVNRKDRFGKNVFEGGFLGLDNIGIFDRSAPCPPAATWSRRTARPGWPCSARTCWNSRSELAAHDHTYEDMAVKFAEHFLLYRRGDEQARAGGHVGRGGRLLLRPAAAPGRQRPAASRPVDGGAAAPVRHHGDRAVAAGAVPQGRCSKSLNACASMPELFEDHSPHRPGAFWRGRTGDHGPGQPGAAPAESLRRCSTKTSF